MKTLSIVLIILFSLNVYAAKEVQNGGGGTKEGGNYQTFGSARITVNKEALAYASVPGLSLLNEKLLAMPVPDNVKADLAAAVIPSFARSYHQITEDKFDPQTRKELTLIYSQILHVPVDQVVIFAVTEPTTKRTMLLPEFFRLSEIEQAAVLFHEALWIVNQKATYQQIISIEQSAQAYFTPGSLKEDLIRMLYTLGRFLNEPILPVVPAIMLDARPSSLMQADWSPVRVPLEQFLGGADVMAKNLCVNSDITVCSDPFPSPIDLRDIMRLRSAQNPESFFFIVMSDFFQESHMVRIDIENRPRFPNQNAMYNYYHGLQIQLSLPSAKNSTFKIFDHKGAYVGTLRIN
ncbi:hypothetical protein B9G69_003680 [Bdellovibrio sp. SKB1291214]|uniref:hypothetical protein n=1 Tax=Bdellovibrio sp. SKB1291214 TaxID=1732569 RepID=UPI000B51D7D7|nr:hypothetical protein [Bdellovibrio sp. SKB1291214]UYL09673.1 hypothetical protein B9G69_003680 [Bdellovibrio sp. SKB1291214]